MDVFVFHSDPGHAWLQVPRKAIERLKLSVTDFSPYSYRSRDGQILYLEEDCDATKFYLAYRATHGTDPRFIETVHRGYCYIRDLSRNTYDGA